MFFELCEILAFKTTLAIDTDWFYRFDTAGRDKACTRELDLANVANVSHVPNLDSFGIFRQIKSLIIWKQNNVCL